MKNEKRKWQGIGFVLPGFIGIIIFYMIPLTDVVRRSFFLTGSGDFRGLENYIEVLQNSSFRLATWNSVRFSLICVPLLVIMSLHLAICLKSIGKLGKLIKDIYLLPMAVPVVTIALFWKIIFDKNGFLNGILNMAGIDAISWLTTDFAFGVLIISYFWKNIGYCTILWIVALEMIEEEIYEAAKMDGADNRALFCYITLPNIRQQGAVIATLSVINTMRVYREAYLVAGEYPPDSIYFTQHLFNNWFRNLEINKMSAGAVINLAIVLLFVVIFWKWGKGDKSDKKRI